MGDMSGWPIHFPMPGARATGVPVPAAPEIRPTESGGAAAASSEASGEPSWPSVFEVPGARRTEGGRVDAAPSAFPSQPPSSTTVFPVPGARPTGRRPAQYLPDAYADGRGRDERPVAGSSSTDAGAGAPASSAADPVMAFLAHMPDGVAEPSVQMWHELVALKTKSLDLQIAEARRREREAELELYRLKHAATTPQSAHSAQTPIAQPSPLPQPLPLTHVQARVQQMAPPPAPAHAPAQLVDSLSGLTGVNSPYSTFPLVTHARSPVMDGVGYPDQLVPALSMPLVAPLASAPDQAGLPAPQAEQAPQTPMTPFDLEAMLHAQEGAETFENLFSWLPDWPAAGPCGSAQNIPLSAAPADLVLTATATTSSTLPTPAVTRQPSVAETAAPAHSSPKRSPGLDSPPPAKKKKLVEKRVVAEHAAVCTTCSASIAKVLLRAPKASFPSPIVVQIRCPDCTGVHQPPSIDPSSTGGTQVGSQETRKRMRAAMEDQDLMGDEKQRRCFCDVCHRIVGSGWVSGGPDEENLAYMAEIVCVSCDGKYQRCTDCGGGGGPRVGIGKWRLKQVFHPGRKTCSLSHSRLGDRPREIGLHVTPTDFAPEQLKEVVTRCRTLWREKTLSRLAVPEMLEIDLPPHLLNPIRNYDDIDDIVTRNWPAREATIRAANVDPARFKRLLGLTWAHAKPRRSVRSVDLEEAHARAAEDEGDMSTVLANVKRTNVVIPPGSELIGMWAGEWDMQHGSLLISTIIPFEDTDSEDSTALSVGELITKVQTLRGEINAARTEAANKEGREPELLPQCEHLWVVSGGHMPLIRARLGDVLVRKRSFVHVEEYLTRHPDFVHALNARPGGLHPDSTPLPHQTTAHPGYKPPEPIVFVRWLGKDFDTQTVNEIKQAEFGGKQGRARLKKTPRSTAR
ncbi:hypothetical protein Q5752_003926 [Cryptotrichosporon argae]